MFHVAVGALPLSDAIYWLADCEEICDSKGETVAIRYAITRLNAAKEAVATFRRPRSQPPESEEIEHAKSSLGKFLRHRDEVLEELKDRQEDRRRQRSISPRAPLPPPPPPGQSAGKQQDYTKVKVPLEQQICLAHNPKEGKYCSRQHNCKRIHLDTTAEGNMTRYKDAESTIARIREAGGRKGAAIL